MWQRQGSFKTVDEVFLDINNISMKQILSGINRRLPQDTFFWLGVGNGIWAIPLLLIWGAFGQISYVWPLLISIILTLKLAHDVAPFIIIYNLRNKALLMHLFTGFGFIFSILSLTLFFLCRASFETQISILIVIGLTYYFWSQWHFTMQYFAILTAFVAKSSTDRNLRKIICLWTVFIGLPSGGYLFAYRSFSAPLFFGRSDAIATVCVLFIGLVVLLNLFLVMKDWPFVENKIKYSLLLLQLVCLPILFIYWPGIFYLGFLAMNHYTSELVISGKVQTKFILNYSLWIGILILAALLWRYVENLTPLVQSMKNLDFKAVASARSLSQNQIVTIPLVAIVVGMGLNFIHFFSSRILYMEPQMRIFVRDFFAKKVN